MSEDDWAPEGFRLPPPAGFDWDRYPDGRSVHFGRDGKPITMEQWGKLFHDEEYHRVALSTYPDLADTIDPDDPLVKRSNEAEVVTVSTVWLGIDHSFGRGLPIIFETMIFGPDDYQYNNECTRYATESQAEEGHWRTMQDLRTGATPWFLRHDEEDANHGAPQQD